MKLFRSSWRKNITKGFCDRLDNCPDSIERILERLDQLGSAAKVFPSLKHRITSIRLRINKSADRLTKTSPQFLGFIKVTKEDFPGIRPAGARSFL